VNRDHERLYLVMQTPDTPAAQAAVDRYVAELAATFEAAVAVPVTVGTDVSRDELREASGAGSLG
jgi:hypothetical protein